MIAIVAGTRTKSGSTNFLRLHVMGERHDGERFFASHERKALIDSAVEDLETSEASEALPVKPQRAPAKPRKGPAKNK